MAGRTGGADLRGRGGEECDPPIAYHARFASALGGAKFVDLG